MSSARPAWSTTRRDIANLPDIEVTRTQMLDLIERVRTEVTRLVPASAPWEWRREEMRGSCDNDGRQGVSLYFAKLTSPRPFTDEEWNLALPAVQRLAGEAGLTGQYRDAGFGAGPRCAVQQ